MSFITDTTSAAGVGATIGSAVPGVGTLLGAGIGAGASALYNGAKALINPNGESSSSVSDLLSDEYISLGKLGNKKATRQMESSARLAALQQYYAKQNAQIDQANTYALTRDTAQLQAEGKRQAGLSLAGDGSVTSASVAPQITSPSIPGGVTTDDSMSELEQGNFIKDVSALISQIGLNKSGERKNNADASKVEIDNMTENERRLEELEQLHNENKISRVEYKRRKTALMLEQETAHDKIEQEHQSAQQSQIETRIKALQEANQAIQNETAVILRDINKEQLKIVQFTVNHQAEKYEVELDNIKANTASAYASAAASRAEVLYKNTLNSLERAKIPYADSLARAVRDSAVNAANESYERKRSLKISTENEINERGYDENGNITDYVKFGSHYVGDVLRNLVGGILSATKTIK